MDVLPDMCVHDKLFELASSVKTYYAATHQCLPREVCGFTAIKKDKVDSSGKVLLLKKKSSSNVLRTLQKMSEIFAFYCRKQKGFYINSWIIMQ